MDLTKYEPMICPVCKNYEFSRLQEGDEDDQTVNICRICGWHCDKDQTNDTTLKNGENELSLDEYRLWYKNKLSENPLYEYFEEMYPYVPVPHNCPVCATYIFPEENSFEICPQCGWEDDGSDQDDSDILGPNPFKFSVFKQKYFTYLKTHSSYCWKLDGNQPYE